jgi:hypothetical protein
MWNLASIVLYKYSPYYDRPIVVEGYDPSLVTKTYATVSRGLAYDDPKTGKVYHLVINKAIHIPHLAS